MKRNLAGNIVNLILLIVGFILFVAAQSIQTGAAMGKGGDFLPKLCSGIWMVLALINFIKELRKTEDENTEAVNIKIYLCTLGLLVVYVALLKPIGFIIASILYLFIQMVLFLPAAKRSRKMYGIFAVISLVTPLFVNWLFVNVFSLILPAGILK